MAHFKDNTRHRSVTTGESSALISVDDLDADALSQEFAWSDISEEPLPAGAYIRRAWAAVPEPFGGGGATTVTADVGENGADVDELLDGIDLTAAANTLLVTPIGVLTLPAFKAAAYVPRVTIASDVNVSTLTAGLVRVVIEWDQLHAE